MKRQTSWHTSRNRYLNQRQIYKGVLGGNSTNRVSFEFAVNKSGCYEELLLEIFVFEMEKVEFEPFLLSGYKREGKKVI